MLLSAGFGKLPTSSVRAALPKGNAEQDELAHPDTAGAALRELLASSGQATALDRVLALPPGQIQGLEHLLVFERAVRKNEFLPNRGQREKLAALLDAPVQPRTLAVAVGILNAIHVRDPKALTGLKVPQRALQRGLTMRPDELVCSPWDSSYSLGLNLAGLVSSDPEALKRLLHDRRPAALALRSNIPGALTPTGNEKLDRNQKDHLFLALMGGLPARQALVECRSVWEPLLSGLSPEWQKSRWVRLWLRGLENDQLQMQHLSPEVYGILEQAVLCDDLERTREDLRLAFAAIADPSMIVPTRQALELFEHGRQRMPQGASQAASRFGQLRSRFGLSPQDSWSVYTATHRHPDVALDLFGEYLGREGVQAAATRVERLPPDRMEEIEQQVRDAFPADRQLHPRIAACLLAAPGNSNAILAGLEQLRSRVDGSLPACLEAVPILATSSLPMDRILGVAEPLVRALTDEPPAVGPALEVALGHLEEGASREEAVRAALGGYLLSSGSLPTPGSVLEKADQVVVGGVNIRKREWPSS